MRALGLVLLVLLAGCVTPASLDGAAFDEPLDTRVWEGLGSVAYVVNITGWDARLELTTPPTRDEEIDAAYLIVANDTTVISWTTSFSQWNQGVHIDAAGEAFDVGASPTGDEGQLIWIERFQPYLWNQSLLFVFAHGGIHGSLPLTVTFNGSGSIEMGPVEGSSFTIDPRTWDGGERVAINAEVRAQGLTVARNMRTDWTTQNGTVFAYVVPEFFPIHARHEHTRISNPNETWEVDLTYDSLGVVVVSPKRGMGPTGFGAVSRETSWDLEVLSRVAMTDISDALLVADIAIPEPFAANQTFWL